MPVSVGSKLLSVVVLLLVFVLTVDYNPECGFGHKDLMCFKCLKKTMKSKGNVTIQKSFGGFLFNGTHEINMPHKCKAV